MRILFFTQPFLPILGGAEIFLDKLARRLADRKHDVTVLAARVRGQDNHVDGPYRVLRYRKPFSKRFLTRHTILYLLRAYGSAKPDCLHAHGTYPQGYSAELFCRLMKIPWVVRPMGAEILPGELFRPRFDPEIGQCLRGATKVIAQSQEIGEIVEGFGVPEERIARIPNGIELESFAGERRHDPAAPRIGMLAVLAERKGFDVMLRAMPGILKRHPRAVLAIAGEGPERDRIEKLSNELGIRDSVELAGVVRGEEKSRFLRSLSVFVSAARCEGFSNANLEALASGAPLVMTPAGGNREIVRDGWNGRLFPIDDVNALESSVLELLADPHELDRLGTNSRVLAGEYTWERIVDLYEELYDGLVPPTG